MNLIIDVRCTLLRWFSRSSKRWRAVKQNGPGLVLTLYRWRGQAQAATRGGKVDEIEAFASALPLPGFTG